MSYQQIRFHRAIGHSVMVPKVAPSFAGLLLHMDGADASTSFPDSSGNGHIVTVFGNAQVDTAESQFGGASLLLAGAGDDYLQLDGSSDFAFGTGDFTIDLWAHFVTNNDSIIYDSRDSGGDGPYVTLWRTATTSLIIYVDGVIEINAGTISIDTWHHIAMTRASGTSRGFIDGTEVGSWSDSTDYANNANRPVIGANGPNVSVNAVDGWIDEVRVIKGTAAWTSNFTPPTEPY